MSPPADNSVVLGRSPEATPASRPSEHEAQSTRSRLGWLAGWFFDGESSSWIASGLTHTAIVFLLSYVTIIQPGIGPDWSLEGSVTPIAADEIDVELATEVPLAQDRPSEVSDAPTPMGLPDLALGNQFADVALPSLIPSAIASPDDLATSFEAIGLPLTTPGGGLEGRSLENRRGTALAGGGNQASEAAVEAGLKWLANHQADDGSWTFFFDPNRCPQCSDQCRNPGVIDSTTASTGLSLLCFLGAGYTHREGPYQQEVSKGIYYLINRMILSSEGGDLRDVSVVTNPIDNILLVRKSGDMYSHAIATLALCEAYAMTRDSGLEGPAQKAITFIANAQNEGGGWRYEPKQPGDLSVTGWQLMALKSGVLGRLDIPRHVWYRASQFVDSVQEAKGSAYGYQSPSKNRPSMTAVGLYGRLMLGWPRNHPPLVRGAVDLSKLKPAENNMYFNYYTSLVLHHVGGNSWKRWNPRMRNYLVGTQSDEGHEKGSWYFDEAWSDRGGRLYTTTLAILTLEVYYRYMPMYQAEVVDLVP